MGLVDRGVPNVTRTIVGAAALLAAGLAMGCGDDVGQSSENATDSFTRPTDHGEFVFGVPNPAEFTDEQRFHAWQFTLTDNAKLDLSTELKTVNLDSVMYLYRRDPGTDSWGSYVGKNDDDGDSLASRIEGDFGAGEYLIKVKAAKTGLRGHFVVHGGCEGAGCPAGPGDACDPNSEIGVPLGNDFTNRCGALLVDVLLAPVTSEWHTETLYADYCDLGGVAAKSVEHYRDYWDGWIGWDDFLGDEPSEAYIYVHVIDHGDAGTVVSIDIGADEDGVSFVYDRDDKLVMYFHSEQSSTSHWYCGVEGEADDLYPDDECAGQLLNAFPHRDGEVQTREGTTTAASAAADLGSELDGKVVAKFASELSLPSSEAIQYTAQGWEHGHALTLSAGGKTTTFYPGGWYDDGIIARTDGDVTALLCESLD